MRFPHIFFLVIAFIVVGLAIPRFIPQPELPEGVQEAILIQSSVDSPLLQLILPPQKRIVRPGENNTYFVDYYTFFGVRSIRDTLFDCGPHKGVPLYPAEDQLVVECGGGRVEYF